MTSDDSKDRQRKKRFHRLIVILMAFDIVFGATIAMVGYVLLRDLAIAAGGAILAAIGIVLLVLFELFGRREA